MRFFIEFNVYNEKKNSSLNLKKYMFDTFVEKSGLNLFRNNLNRLGNLKSIIFL